jgi:hypothetical protein
MRKILAFLLCLTLMGCQTSVFRSWNNWRSDSYHYSDYEIQISSEPAGAKIEWNGKYIGQTPLVWRLSGYVYADEVITVKAYPVSPQQYLQVKKIGMDVPSKIHFDMSLKPNSE